MEEEFVKSFDEFYLELTILNYKFKTKCKEFTEKEKKALNYLKLLLPTYKRLKNGCDNSEIEKILQEIKYEPTPSTPVLQYQSTPVIRLSIDTDSDGYNNISEDDKTSEDLEGDTLVNKLTEISLSLLSNIQKNNWAIVENDSNDEDEYTDNDEDDDGDEDEDEDDEDDTYDARKINCDVNIASFLVPAI
ncbi:hypothetical protein Indivirus_1_134 [Indivirus ILV1]|uniref:Uncharacterized protein n=1 Tax=Indivirus ILV1 TaxID=1977633 RepID=A0A1V0SCU2_9VIRU|nr:hypothetical protein Indivirus_1_134 [Indivirus ILV1]